MKPSVEILIEKYRNNLYVMAFSVCKNAQDAEDVVQDTFIQYWSQKKEFESEQHIRAWLIRVAINKAKNKNNTFFRRNALPLEDYIQTLTFESEEFSELFEAVMNLPEKYRIVIHLFCCVYCRLYAFYGERYGGICYGYRRNPARDSAMDSRRSYGCNHSV